MRLADRPTPIGSGRLRGRPDQDLVHVDAGRLLEGVEHRAGDVVVGERRRSGRLSKNGVSTMPGSIRVTLIVVLSCIWRSSWRRLSAIPVTAHFVDGVERAGERAAAGDRAGDHEVAGVLPRAGREGGADRQRGAVDVGQDHRAPVLGRLLEEAPRRAEPRVGEDARRGGRTSRARLRRAAPGRPTR